MKSYYNKKKYRVIALTDHSRHTDENSIYAILSKMHLHERIERIDVVSRGVRANQKFFGGDINVSVYASRIQGEFKFKENPDDFISEELVRIEEYDIILMRLPRPVSDGFLMSLDKFSHDKLIINKPKGIIESSNKKFLLNFQALCPPIKLCYSIEEIMTFSEKYDLVLKPLKEYGGKGILRLKSGVINDGLQNYDAGAYLFEKTQFIQEEGYLAMKYLTNVDKGDKRLLVVNGVILASSLRMPAKESWICNVAQGGFAVSSEPDPEELEIVDKINPSLQALGILIYGVDTLMGDNNKRVLSEINTLSIGGFKAADEQNHKSPIDVLLTQIIGKADERYKK